MNRLVVRSRVDPDGVLRIAVPVGVAKADHEMLITVEPVPTDFDEQQEYSDWLDSIEGQWQGEFERMPQGEWERRDPL